MTDKKKPLFHSALYDDYKNAKTAIINLLQQGADVQADDNYALIESIDNGNLELVKFLVDNGANIHARDDWAIQGPAGMGRHEMVEYVISLGVDVNANGNKALEWAADRGDLKMVKILIQNGVKVETLNEHNIHSACFNNHYDIIRLLFENGLKGKNIGEGPLRVAVQNGHLDIVQILLQNGVDPTANENMALRFGYNRQKTLSETEKTILRQMVVFGADLSLIDNRHASQIFGSPAKAINNLETNDHEDFIQNTVNRHIKHSKKGIMTLMEAADEWLKPYYMKALSNL